MISNNLLSDYATSQKPIQPLHICTSGGREILRLTPDGNVIVNPEFTTDEAAKAFWDAVKLLAGGFVK